ncbi:MAG: iron-sulfur cluster assembly accessory protein [Candidatus Omnitrophica bacterium]|nr:iron-sulfur cluster assembly accessory protein [Candidatus Omnitrophota bacterium]
MIEISSKAVDQFKKFISESDIESGGIRIFVAGRGCCGLSFGMDISENGEKEDRLVEKDGLKLFIQPAAFDALSNATIDYVDEGNNSGFVIKGIGSSC